MDDDERRLLEDGVRQRVQAHTGPALDAALLQLGWSEALADDARTAVSILFEQQGAANAMSSALDEVIATAAAVERKPDQRLLLPPIDGCACPGMITTDGLTVRGLSIGDIPGEGAVVVVETDDQHVAVVVGREDLRVRHVSGVDPDCGLVEVATGQPIRMPADGQAARWETGLSAGRVALAHQLVGASRAMLRLACEHAVVREQFGRTIASFQAIRHRLAEAFVAVEAADAATAAAWTDPSPLGAKLAKACAGRAARTAARHVQQVLGGIGFTTEHPLHRYVRRATILDGLLGSSRTLTRELGAEVLLTRRLPPMLPL